MFEFEPALKASSVSLPAGCAEINKTATSDFNQRVLETRLASRLLAKVLQLSDECWKGKPRPRFAEVQQGNSCPRPGDMLIFVEKYVHDDFYTVDELEKELGVSKEKMIEIDFPNNTRHG